MNARRVAALYDVHGNLPALEAVLADVEKENVDLIVIGGDVAWGPMAVETVRRLRALGERGRFVRGNADREVGERLDEKAGFDEITAAVTAWCADRLSPEERSWLRDMQPEERVDMKGIGRVLFCHGSPRSDEEILTVATPRGRLSSALHDVAADLVVCGHTHMQFDLVHDDVRVVNAGSVGLPYEGRGGAYWTLLADDVELRRTEYDVTGAVERFRASGCPHVEEVFVEALVEPPAPAEVAAQFERLASQRES